MKRLFIAVVALVATLDVMAWGTLGHCTIAEIAERNLTPKAKANIEKYTKGNPLASYAMWMDRVGKDPVLGRKGATRGWHATIVDENCKTSQQLRNEKRKGRDAVTGLLDLEKMLAQREQLSDSVVMFALKSIIHMVGDMHCPSHMRYTDNRNTCWFDVYYHGQKILLHSVWDNNVFQSKFKKEAYRDYADHLNTYSKKQIKKAANGWVEDWIEDAARDVRPTLDWGVRKGDNVGVEFDQKAIPLAELQLQKAGYRLAKYLNKVFK